MNAQAQFHFDRRPAQVPDVGAIYRHWLDTGETPPGCSINVRVWDHARWSQARIRRELRARQILSPACLGVVRYYHEPGQTLCDYDQPNLCPSWFNIVNVARSIGLKPRAVEYHRTARGWHLAIKWDREITPAATVAVQLLLGSDRGREAFNLRRLLDCGQSPPGRRWNLLFEFKLGKI